MFGGKEIQDELSLNMYDFHARQQDPIIGRFTSIDPMTEKYYGFSSYNYCANNPINVIDPTGMIVFTTNQDLMKRMVDDLNKIYSAKYANSIPAFSYTSTTKKESVKTNSFDLFSPSTWFSDAKYETVRTNEYQLKANEDFDWSKDKYTNAMKEVIDDPFRVQVSSVLDENGSFLRDYGGGFTEPVSSIKLSSKLSNFGDKGTTGKFAKQWTIGGVAMHELLYHVHYLGVLEDDIMRTHYNTKTGTCHPPFNRDQNIIGRPKN